MADRTAAERQRRRRARLRSEVERDAAARRSAVTVEPQLHEAAVRARVEAVARLGDDAARFTVAIERFVNAVEVADQARREWESADPPRPLWTRGALGQLVEHPLIRTMDRLDRAAAAFGAALGLDPVSEKRLGRVGKPGRPEGAVSADDRASAPPVVRLKQVG